MIATFVSRFFAEDGVPGLMTRVQLPKSSENPSTTTIVDSQNGDTALTSATPKVDSVILVYDLSRPETFARLEQHWLPLLERAYQGKVRQWERHIFFDQRRKMICMAKCI